MLWSPTLCCIYLLQEEELRTSGDPKFGHLADDLHVEVTAVAPPAEAHARLAYALTEIRRYLVPVSPGMSQYRKTRRYLMPVSPGMSQYRKTRRYLVPVSPGMSQYRKARRYLMPLSLGMSQYTKIRWYRVPVSPGGAQYRKIRWYLVPVSPGMSQYMKKNYVYSNRKHLLLPYINCGAHLPLHCKARH